MEFLQSVTVKTVNVKESHTLGRDVVFVELEGMKAMSMKCLVIKQW